MIAALAMGARVLDEPSYADAAKRAVGFILNSVHSSEDSSGTVIATVNTQLPRIWMIMLFSFKDYWNYMKQPSMSIILKML